MSKRSISFLLAMAMIIVTVPSLGAASSATLNGLNQTSSNVPGTGQSPSLSVTLRNLNQVTETVGNPSPTMSMTLQNLNQIADTVNSPGLSPTLSMTLNNLNQVSGVVNSPGLSPTLSMTLGTLNQFAAAGEYGASLTGLFTIMDSLTEDARAAFDAIASYVGNGHAVIGYFDKDMAELILNGALSPHYRGFDFSTLILSEYVSLGINGYQANGAGVSTTFGFASEYAEGQTVVVMFGYKDKNGDIVWNALNTVAVNGQVKVDFPAELLIRAGSEAILGILS